MAELNREFGELLTQGLKSTAAHEKNKPISALEDELGFEMGVTRSSIDKWRQGNIPRDPNKVAFLAQTCVRRGSMDKQWLSRFLTQASFRNKKALEDELFPEENQTAPTIYHDLPVVHNNLPRRPYEKFVGRETELSELRRYLSPRYRLGIVCLSGMGGVGKTALALETAYRYWKSPKLPPEEPFEAIIWVTDKQVELLPKGPTLRRPTFTDLDGLYRAIAEVLDLPAITRAVTSADSDIIVARTLSEHRVLLVLDNLEDVDDPALMVFLRELPTPSKAIVTTRHRIDMAVSIHLHTFNEEQARELIRLECQRHNLSLINEDTEKLLRHTDYLPLAIVRTIGRMAWRGSSVEAELRQLADPANKIYDFCFERSITIIRGGNAHKLFMALAIFATDPSRDALGYVAGFKENILDRDLRDEGLSDLEVLSLVNKEGNRFSLESLTKVKAQTELTANPEFERETRRRWVEWYLDFTKEFGGEEWTEWHLQYDRVEEEWENLLAVFEWCAAHEQYDEIRAFWQPEGVLNVAYIYGYWDDRLNWLDWLIKMAERRGDWSTAVEAMMEKGYTLSVMGRLEGADNILRRAWSLHDYATPRVQVKLAQVIAHHRIYQKQYKDAFSWLDQAKMLLGAARLDEREYLRRQFDTQSYYGWLYSEIEDYRQAEMCFRDVLEDAQTIGWQRAVIYAQNWLANIAITQGKLDEAETLLQMGLTVSERNKDKRRVAFSKHAFALLHRKRGNLDESRRWAVDALDDFERLGMQREAAQVKKLLQKLQGQELRNHTQPAVAPSESG